MHINSNPDLGCLIKLVANHYFIKGFQVSLECLNENKCAYIAHLGVQYFLYHTLECAI